MILHLWVMCFYERAVCMCKKKTHIVVLSQLHCSIFCYHHQLSLLHSVKKYKNKRTNKLLLSQKNTLYIQCTGGPLLARFFETLRLWKINCVSRKPCKRKSDLVLCKWKNESTKINRVIEKTLLLENRVSRGLPVFVKTVVLLRVVLIEKTFLCS